MMSWATTARAFSSSSSRLCRAASTLALPAGLGCRARPGTRLGDEDFALEYFDAATGAARSPWHDVALRAAGCAHDSGVLNFVNEIPRFTTAKMEIDTAAAHNPIVQDRKNGATVASELIKAGANVSLPNGMGWTALHCAM